MSNTFNSAMFCTAHDPWVQMTWVNELGWWCPECRAIVVRVELYGLRQQPPVSNGDDETKEGNDE